MKERYPNSFGICYEGLPLILFTALCAEVFAFLSWPIAAITFLMLTFFVMNFFRDPQRIPPEEEGVVVSPADGKVVDIRTHPEPFTGENRTRISIFMNVFNVHVNRSPISGKVKRIKYIKGKFFNASLDKASSDNERNLMLLEDKEGRSFTVVQIAGLIARRIVCWTKRGEELEIGERLGLIKFGSRVDLYLPEGYEINTKVGERVLAGIDIVARKKLKE